MFLDEATSSIDASSEAAAYAALRAAGIAYVSVGHAAALHDQHDAVLRLTGDGSGAWQLQACGPHAGAAAQAGVADAL